MLMMSSLCTCINIFEGNVAACKYCLGTPGFEKIMIYRPGLLRLSRGMQMRRGNNFRLLEWMARQFCALFDWGDWLSISTDDLATVMVENGLDFEDHLAHKHETKKVLKCKRMVHLFVHCNFYSYFNLTKFIFVSSKVAKNFLDVDGGTTILEHSDIVGHMIKNLWNFSR